VAIPGPGAEFDKLVQAALAKDAAEPGAACLAPTITPSTGTKDLGSPECLTFPYLTARDILRALQRLRC
jgi:hypothetical protein